MGRRGGPPPPGCTRPPIRILGFARQAGLCSCEARAAAVPTPPPTPPPAGEAGPRVTWAAPAAAAAVFLCLRRGSHLALAACWCWRTLPAAGETPGGPATPRPPAAAHGLPPPSPSDTRRPLGLPLPPWRGEWGRRRPARPVGYGRRSWGSAPEGRSPAPPPAVEEPGPGLRPRRSSPGRVEPSTSRHSFSTTTVSDAWSFCTALSVAISFAPDPSLRIGKLRLAPGPQPLGPELGCWRSSLFSGSGLFTSLPWF